jgi:hypothetical protein
LHRVLAFFGNLDESVFGVSHIYAFEAAVVIWQGGRHDDMISRDRHMSQCFDELQSGCIVSIADAGVEPAAS